MIAVEGSRSSLALGAGDVHVWYGSLDASEPKAARLARVLSEEEDRRARDFIDEAHQRRSIVARATLRMLLARYLGERPSAIRLTRGEHGKPRLADRQAPLYFNVSHSGDLAVYAVTRAGELGVDLEKIRSISNLDALAVRTCSAAELSRFREVRPAERQRHFLQLWTCKEAYLKAVGVGMGVALDRIETCLESRSVDVAPESRSEGARWTLAPLASGNNFVGAIVVAGVRPDMRASVFNDADLEN